MIARLRATLVALEAALDDGESRSSVDALAAECADALRLQLDCMQADLSPSQRDALHALGEVLEDDSASRVAIAEVIRRAAVALGAG